MTDLLNEAGLTPPPSRYTERDMLNALHARYSQRSQGGTLQRYVCAEHVRASCGFAGWSAVEGPRTMRTADFIAQDTWKAQGLLLHGHEVKVSRAIGDKWLVESGLAAGDKLIVEGLQKIRPGAPVQATEQGSAPPAAAKPAAATPAAK